MILRSWHGAVPIEKADGFRKYLLKTGIAEAKATPGNLAAYMYDVGQGDYVHFFMVSYWEGMEAVKAFAGDLPYIAVTYPEDYKYELISDPIVIHHEVDRLPDAFPVP